MLNMNVTKGLISRLVKTKSTERVLASIASQVSLLMILSEVEGDESSDASALNLSACVEKVTEAVDVFIKMGHDRIHQSFDPLFDSQMGAACETLELAKSELFVAGQRVSGSPASTQARTALVTAAKDVLQAVLRILVVVDDVEVRRCVQAVSSVKTKVMNIGNVRDARDMVPAFKMLTEAVLYLTMMTSRRQKELVSSSQSDELMTGLNLLRKGVSSLRMVTQTYLKYPSNPQAMACKQQVLDQLESTLADLRTTLESGPPSDLDTDQAGHFVDHINKIVEGLSEENRSDLNLDMESWVASIIRHAMGVAHLCQGTYRHLITRTCQKILQCKFRLLDVQQSMQHTSHLPEISQEYEGVCEILLDEFCEVEKHVNMALLNLIIDTCCFTSQPLERLASAAIHNEGGIGADVGRSSLASEFSCHGDKLCQVAGLASASSNDPKKVRAVKLATSRLEQLHPEVIPAVGAVARHPGNVADIRHLKGLVQDWEKETESLVQALDSMTDPKVFLHVTEQRMRQGANVIRGKLSEKDEKGAEEDLRKLLAHARRMTQVTTRVVDHHFDPVFRNGLMVYVQQLESARHGVKDASRAALDDMNHPRLLDTLHRRLGLLLDAATDLRLGVKGEISVDLLNPAREKVRRQHLLSDKPKSAGQRKTDSKAGIQDGKETTQQETSSQYIADILAKVKTGSLDKAVPAASVEAALAADTASPEVKDKNLPAATTSPRQSQGSPAVKKQRSKDLCSAKSSSKHPEQNEESTAMLQRCGDELMTSAMRADKAGVARWNGDVLGWTSHLGEVALSLLDHCHHAARKSEMRQLTVEVDRLAPLVIEAARFVAAGDRSQTTPLRLAVDDWVKACHKLRILVDVASGDWRLLIEEVAEAVAGQENEALKSLLSILDRNHREMNHLLSRARTLEGHHIPRGRRVVEFFLDGQLELDNLTATLKTTADCIATTGDTNTVNRSQLVQRGREWCVLMTCLVTELDHMADTLSAAGQRALGIPAFATSQTAGIRLHSNINTKVVPVLQAETARLKKNLACFTAGGDEAMKKRAVDLVQSLTDLMGEVVEIANTPLDNTTLPQAQLFARLDAGLARSLWTEKALDAEQFVHRRCLKFSALVTNLLLSDGYQETTDGLPAEVAELQSKVKAATQRALQAIQLSADLQRRGMVRHCLDSLSDLLPTITQAAMGCSSGVDKEKSERDLLKAGTQWGAKVHQLLATLKAMGDVKPSAITELERQLTAQPREPAVVPLTQAAPQQTPTHTPTASPCTQYPSSPQTPGADTHTHRASTYTPVHNAYSSSPRKRTLSPHSPGSPSSPYRDNRNMTAALSPRQRGSRVRSRTFSDSGPSGQVEQPAAEMSPYRRSALYTSWLASAQYLGEEVAGWEDSDNQFVQLVHSMAQNCHRMADFAQGGTSLKDSEEVSKTGLELAASGKELKMFADSLLAMSPQHRYAPEKNRLTKIPIGSNLTAEDLRKTADRLATYANQLHIVASVLQSGPINPQGDCILARNAANLIEAVREMFSLSESISVAGSLEPRMGNETDRQVLDLLTRWQQKLASYHLQRASIPDVDELGLRRIEVHNPPSLTSLVDQ